MSQGENLTFLQIIFMGNKFANISTKFATHYSFAKKVFISLYDCINGFLE